MLDVVQQSLDLVRLSRLLLGTALGIALLLLALEAGGPFLLGFLRGGTELVAQDGDPLLAGLAIFLGLVRFVLLFQRGNSQ